MGLAPSCLSKLSADDGSYDTERREKRTVWYHVANAFSILVSTIAPTASNEQIKVISNYDR
jgi:hypothetical protein